MPESAILFIPGDARLHIIGVHGNTHALASNFDRWPPDVTCGAAAILLPSRDFWYFARSVCKHVIHSEICYTSSSYILNMPETFENKNVSFKFHDYNFYFYNFVNIFIFYLLYWLFHLSFISLFLISFIELDKLEEEISGKSSLTWAQSPECFLFPQSRVAVCGQPVSFRNFHLARACGDSSATPRVSGWRRWRHWGHMPPLPQEGLL